MTQRVRPPGRGTFVRDVERRLPECLPVARLIAERQHTFVTDVPNSMRGQLERLAETRRVVISEDGYVRRNRVPNSSLGRADDRCTT